MQGQGLTKTKLDQIYEQKERFRKKVKANKDNEQALLQMGLETSVIDQPQIRHEVLRQINTVMVTKLVEHMVTNETKK